jgi:hypothetical protein
MGGMDINERELDEVLTHLVQLDEERRKEAKTLERLMAERRRR